jgi:hypothetical protein
MNENSLKDDHSIQHLIMQDLEYLTMIDDCAFCGLEELKVWAKFFIESGNVYIETKRKVDPYIAFLRYPCVVVWRAN